ncbi:hypothetical protein CEXT_295011 [Caerostris extrusa]|uniref:Uncharacterized protein n=1 Tax=Caerostris extrusa TaxID=172846 RepID=A0AAV4RVK1_CAEEX|nr:hypothetical protein CEXT_295011 [Caerostris extrusa]
MRTRPALPAPRPPRPLYRPASKRLYYKFVPPPSSVDLVYMARRRINKSCLLDSVNTNRAWRKKCDHLAGVNANRTRRSSAYIETNLFDPLLAFQKKRIASERSNVPPEIYLLEAS